VKAFLALGYVSVAVAALFICVGMMRDCDRARAAERRAARAAALPAWLAVHAPDGKVTCRDRYGCIECQVTSPKFAMPIVIRCYGDGTCAAWP